MRVHQLADTWWLWRRGHPIVFFGGSSAPAEGAASTAFGMEEGGPAWTLTDGDEGEPGDGQ